MLQRSTGELASYQQKMFRIDDHVGIAIAGLTSDARVLRCVGLFGIREPAFSLERKGCSCACASICAVISCANKPWLQE